jgi:hypothetical protein
VQPLLPLGGYAGWRFLSQSLPAQVERFAAGPVEARETAYFRDTIASISTPEALVSDYRLLRVALGAYGLQQDLPNRAFIRTLLEQGTTDSGALANRFADKRYRNFAEAFGFGGPLPPKTSLPGFADRMLARFTRQSFEEAVGAQDETMRLALTAQRELGELTARRTTDTTAWLSVLGTPPLRKVFETALGLPASIGTLDIDRQVSAFRQAAERTLGQSEIAQFADPERVEDLIRVFTLKSEAASGPSPLTPGYAALVLLGGAV